jgi:hypothetical protein
MSTINLELEITRRNRAVIEKEQESLNEQKRLDGEVERVLANADAAYRNTLMSELGFDYKLTEAQAIQKERDGFPGLPKDRIMDADAIKGICIEFGLRFLPTRFYKGALHEGIGPALEKFRMQAGGTLPVTSEPELMRGRAVPMSAPTGPQFYICAPEESFVLRPVPKDPLLFCRLSAKKFFLVHKWGTDLDAGEAEKRKGTVTERNWNADTKDVDMMDMMIRLQASAMASKFGLPSGGESRKNASGRGILGGLFD